MLYSGFLPKKEEVKNQEIKSLVKRLKGKNNAETLINILEWEDRNLTFWDERWTIYLVILFIALSSAILAAILVLPLLGINFSLVFVAVLVIALVSCKFLEFLIPLIFSFSVSIALICMAALLAGKVVSSLLLISVLMSLLVGASFSVFSLLILKYRNIKRRVPDFKVSDTFVLSLPIEKILNYRLAVCRDYAKLTMVMLLNLYPDEKLYFVTIPKHVATAIKFNGNIYVLDQKLPILTLEKWTLFWKQRRGKKELKPTLLRVIKGSNESIKVEKVKEFSSRSKTNHGALGINLEKMVADLKRELFIREHVSAKNAEIFRVLILKNFEILYEKDQIIERSIERLVKRKIENEFCGRVRDIIDITLEIENGDLVSEIQLKESEKDDQGDRA